MKLFIADDYKLTKFNLPKEAQESFLIAYKPGISKKEYTISIESKDGFWILKSNGLVNVIENGQVILETKLVDYGSYQIEISGDKTIRYVFCLPSSEKKLNDLSCFNISSISIGNDNNCNICYPINMIQNNHIVINISDNKALLTSNANFAYVNNKLVKQTYLKLGDVIFLYGLKLIWMGNFIRINNPSGLINVNGMQSYGDLSTSDNSQYEKTNSQESEIELYDANSYFFHTPRIRNYLVEESITIDAPPQEEKMDQTPAILSIGSSLTMAASSLMMGYNVIYGINSGNKKIASVIPQIVMCISMIIGSLIMPQIINIYNKNQKKKKEKFRQQKYISYLQKKENEIKKIIEKQTNILNSNYPTPEECANIILKRDKRLWERQIADDDFLSIGLGIGNTDSKIKIQSPEEHFKLEEDNLEQMVIKMVNNYKKLNGVPITYSLIKQRFSALICNIPNKYNYINSIILQLLAFQSALDLKLVFFTENSNYDTYEYTKYLPHTWSEDKRVRYFANNISDMKQISDELSKEYKSRLEKLSSAGKDENKDIKKEKSYKNFSTYFLIITDCYKKIKDLPFIVELLKSEENLGFSMMFIENNLSDLPPQCSTFAYALENNSYIIEPAENNNITRSFELRKQVNVNMQIIAGVLSNIPIEAKEQKSELPKTLTFLEMYNVSKIEQLNILNRWETNNPVNNLKTPIGVHADREPFILDLHEKAHGPHGLIAGSTGSGKSEFIITFILSMAVNFHPNEVQFVLIDYKGGGLTGAFENRETGISLPHLAGTITNLDTAEMNRTLVSINSELKRRQRMFNEVRDRLGEGTVDIYKYQQLYRDGKIDEPIAHLFIISDEFAELKSQQPEFMDELISTARIGRSLGVHLILATQKPSGVVNDQIWANSKFKICLKVQDRGDSMEMLKRPEAASIKEAGRFYLQVGYDEYFDIGQSGYSGSNYIPSDRIIKKVDDSINYINNIGSILKTITDEQKENNTVAKPGNQLTNTVKYIVELAKKQNVKIRKLWLSSIPELIYLLGLKTKYEYEPVPYQINPIIGEYDNPSAQEQGILTVDLSNKGNTVIYGSTGSGKENLLTTLIYSTCIMHSPEEINFYIFDFGAETLKIFNKFPHIGSIATIEDEDLIMNTLIMIDEEAGKRKEMFTDYAGSYSNYIKESGNKLPLIVVVINSFDIFSETNSRLAEALSPLFRDGLKYGIVFVITTSTNQAVRTRTAQLFLNKISLQQNNPDDFRGLLNSPRGLIPKKIFGRGIVSLDSGCYEFQTAYICDKEKINQTIRATATELLSKYKTKAISAKTLPNEITFDMISDQITDLSNVPIGFSKSSKETYVYDFEKNPTTMILSDSINDNLGFVYGLSKILSNIKGTEITIIDSINLYHKQINGIKLYNNNFDSALIDMINEINKESDMTKRVFIILGLQTLKEKLTSGYINSYNALFSNINRFKNSKIIIFDNYSSFKNIQLESWYINAFNDKYGIWLGQNVSTQMTIKFDEITSDDRKENYPYLGFVCENGKTIPIKYVIDEVEKSNE